MHGVKRVLVFCIMTVLLPTTLIILPLHLRRTVFADVIYPVAESDIIEIRDGISSIFCQQHSLHMSSNFNAFQLRNRPAISNRHKHIRLKKSMTLPDDTLEYWGFYLLKGAKVYLKFCSRYDGASIMVVKGQRELRTCGLLEHNKNKFGANYAAGHEQVKVTFEDITEIVNNDANDELEKLANETKKVEMLVHAEKLMEQENHGGEDLNEIESEITERLLLPSSTPAIVSSSKMPRKKLKKGTLPTQQPIKQKTELEQTNHETTTLLEKENANANISSASSDESLNSQTVEDARFLRKHELEHEQHRQQLYDQLFKEHRPKRETIYDRRFTHGGNAVNFTETDESNSVSSFENGLFECFDGDILLTKKFPPFTDCLNTNYLESGSHRMLADHEINENGYYYYIFYSDNDLVRNDIHAIFDIYKPTFQYSNLSDTQGCVNTTNCTFPIGFMSSEIVVVEVPTRDGIEHEEDDITNLISTCHPRTIIYAIFPITVLLLILSCSFL